VTTSNYVSQPARPPLRPGRGVHVVDLATRELGLVHRADPYEDHVTLRAPGTERTWQVSASSGYRYATTQESIRIAFLEDA